MYRSHDMRHIGFPQVDGGQRDPQKLGRHNGYEVLEKKNTRSYKEILITSNWLDICFRNEHDSLISEMYG